MQNEEAKGESNEDDATDNCRLADRRRRFIKLGLAAGGAASLGIAAPAIAQRARVFRFGHMMPPDTLYHRAIVMFCDEVAKLSSGKMKLDAYPSSQLGSIAEMLSAVKVGSLTMSMAVPAWYSSFMKPIDAFTLPYLVSSQQRLRIALDGAVGRRSRRSAMAPASGARLLADRRSAYRQQGPPDRKTVDCQGLKIRVINSQVYIRRSGRWAPARSRWTRPSSMSACSRRHRRLRVSAARPRRLQAL